jgi:hypothetical protein
VKQHSTNAVPAGYSLKASVIPEASAIQAGCKIPLRDGDALYIFNGVGYDIYAIDPDAGGWTPFEPTNVIAKGFFVQNNNSPTNWIRHFTVQ